MQNLTRRTALAAVPALAALPAMAAVNPQTTADLKVSPQIAALVAEYHRMTDEADKASAESSRLRDAIEARGIVHPGTRQENAARQGCPKTWAVVDGKTMEVTGDPLNPYREPVPIQTWEQAIEAYGSAHDAQPETPRIKVLDKAYDECLDRKWAIVDEIVESRAETPGDLVAQVELWLAHSTDLNLDGTISAIHVDTQAEAFVLRLPSDIRRLAGAS